MRRQLAGLYPDEGVADLQECGTILIALEYHSIKRLFQETRQINWTMKVRSY